MYDKAIDGRNRRYYKITDTGRSQLNMYVTEWGNYSKMLTELFENEKSGVIDKNGNKIIETKYEDVKIPNPEQAIFICYK